MRWTWFIEQIELLLRWFFEKFLSIVGDHLFNPFSKMLLWSVLLLQDAAESARKAEQSRKRAEDIAAGTVQMNGRELFLHEPWVFDDSRFWGFFLLAQTAFHSLAANACFLLTRASSMIYSRNILLEIWWLCLWQRNCVGKNCLYLWNFVNYDQLKCDSLSIWQRISSLISAFL